MSWWGHVEGYIHTSVDGLEVFNGKLEKFLGYTPEDDVYLEFPPAYNLAKRVHLYNTIEKDSQEWLRRIECIAYNSSDRSVRDRHEIILAVPVRGSEGTFGINMSVYTEGQHPLASQVAAINISGDLRDFYGQGDLDKLREWWLQALMVLGGTGMLRVFYYGMTEIWIDDNEPIKQPWPEEEPDNSEL